MSAFRSLPVMVEPTVRKALLVTPRGGDSHRHRKPFSV
jgi:hypothetical protein